MSYVEDNDVVATNHNHAGALPVVHALQHSKDRENEVLGIASLYSGSVLYRIRYGALYPTFPSGCLGFSLDPSL